MKVVILTWILSTIFVPIRAPPPSLSDHGYVQRIDETSQLPSSTSSSFTNPSTASKLEQSANSKSTTKQEQASITSSDQRKDDAWKTNLQLYNDTKKPEETTSQSSDPQSENSQSEDGWKGPKSSDDKPEQYSVDDNVSFVRQFASDMTIVGKYKVGEVIYYLLTKKFKELDTADKAALEYVIDERLKKDTELIELYKKTKENEKKRNKANQPPTSSGQDADEGIPMPSYMLEILSPSFTVSQFEPPPPRIMDRRVIPIVWHDGIPFIWRNGTFSTLPGHFPRPRYQGTFQGTSGYSTPVSNPVNRLFQLNPLITIGRTASGGNIARRNSMFSQPPRVFSFSHPIPPPGFPRRINLF